MESQVMDKYWEFVAIAVLMVGTIVAMLALSSPELVAGAPAGWRGAVAVGAVLVVVAFAMLRSEFGTRQ